MNIDDLLEGELFFDALELIDGERERACVWEQAFNSYLQTKYETYHAWWEERLSDTSITDLVRDAYWFANKKLEEYIANDSGYNNSQL